MKIEEKIAILENHAKLCERNGMYEWKEECEQHAAWLRELQERRKADSCEGCMYRYGEKLTCQLCARYYRDKYVAKRRTDG